ncbi:MAG: signal recognition particle protein [Actinomycetota bacterium]
MFDTLTDRLNAVFKKVRSRGKLHPKQVETALGDIRLALLDADVAVEVADDFLDRVRTRALSEEVMNSLTPGQQIVKVVRDELQVTLGGEMVPFQLPGASPAVVMMAGVQGSGKTTACAKIAKLLKSKGKRPLLVAADLHRPGAVDQLITLGSEIGVPVVSDGKDAVKVAKSALKEASRQAADVVIVDTAGRLHVDEDMMREARRVRDTIRPHHVLMACDAMVGQDAVIQARAFMDTVDTTGFVLTKIDGDARGGAALSITGVTGRPVFFVGTGERPDDLEPFYPDRMASRILGMGDVLTLIDKAQEKMDADSAKESAERLLKAQFTLEDFLTQLREMQKLGPIQDVLGMLPGVPGGKNAMKDLAGQVDDGHLKRAEALILSMTPEERQNPAIIQGSRRLRIARGSGTTTAEVNGLLKDFEGARKMMRSMMGGKRMPGMAGLAGGLGGLAAPGGSPGGSKRPKKKKKKR